MLHLKDSYQFIEALEAELDVKNILLETTFISQSTTISTQLNQFQQKDNNLSLVVDEYGEIQGLLTMEDIFTEIDQIDDSCGYKQTFLLFEFHFTRTYRIPTYLL